MADNKSTVLEITSRSTTPKLVKIDGEDYELVPEERITFGEVAFILHANKMVSKLLEQSEVLEDSKYEEATDNVIRAVSKILKAPTELISKLSTNQQLEIINVWSDQRDNRPLSKTSAKRSRASKGSTGATRKAG